MESNDEIIFSESGEGGYHNLNDDLSRCQTSGVLMQFTGLHDKNGKEIYEGDIVKTKDDTLKVFWNSSTASFDVEFSGGDCEPLVPFYGEWYPDQHEVIGNIHENPELLKG
jgi:uncharacterized phage protein (TIGR01671 family)